jgi:hypothetical protein
LMSCRSTVRGSWNHVTIPVSPRGTGRHWRRRRLAPGRERVIAIQGARRGAPSRHEIWSDRTAIFGMVRPFGHFSGFRLDNAHPLVKVTKTTHGDVALPMRVPGVSTKMRSSRARALPPNVADPDRGHYLMRDLFADPACVPSCHWPPCYLPNRHMLTRHDSTIACSAISRRVRNAGLATSPSGTCRPINGSAAHPNPSAMCHEVERVLITSGRGPPRLSAT